MGITHATVATIPDDANAEVGTDEWNEAHAIDLSDVAAGGELAGFMDAPTVDATHSGSTHASILAAALGLPLGLTGATAATRYVGATTSGAPASGTFAVGDIIVGQNGIPWVCITAGTPGTWAQVGPGTLTIGPFDRRFCQDHWAYPTANKAFFNAFMVNSPVTVSQAKVQIAAAQSGNIDIGIYSSAGARLASTGSTAAGGTWADQTINLTAAVTLLPGIKYWAAIAADNTTVDLMARLGWAGTWDVPMELSAEMATAFPLPVTATFAAGGSVQFYMAFA